MTWREQLLDIKFFEPLEKASSDYFSNTWNHPVGVSMSHKFDLENDGVKITMVLSSDDKKLMSSDLVFHRKQIEAAMPQCNNDLQALVGTQLIKICEQMYVALSSTTFKYFVKNFKPKENVTMDGKTETHSNERESSDQEAGSNIVSGS